MSSPKNHNPMRENSRAFLLAMSALARRSTVDPRRLSKWLKDNGLSAKQIARTFECSIRAAENWHSGKNAPAIETLFRMLDAWGVQFGAEVIAPDDRDLAIAVCDEIIEEQTRRRERLCAERDMQLCNDREQSSGYCNATFA